MSPELRITDSQWQPISDWLTEQGEGTWLGATSPTTHVFQVEGEPLIMEIDKFESEPRISLITSQELLNKLNRRELITEKQLREAIVSQFDNGLDTGSHLE